MALANAYMCYIKNQLISKFIASNIVKRAALICLKMGRKLERIAWQIIGCNSSQQLL